MKYSFDVKDDLNIFLEMKGIDFDSFASRCGLTRFVLDNALNGKASNDVLEKIYEYFFRQGLHLTVAKNELLLENKTPNSLLLYYGSREGISNISCAGSRVDADFSSGFYCSEKLESAIDFIDASPHSSVYVFESSLADLKIARFVCSDAWVLLICYFHGYLADYKESPVIQGLLKSIDGVDLIIAPIADNKMYQILGDFASGSISSTVTMHSLSASRLGNQYVSKTQKAVDSLSFLSRLYICSSERKESQSRSKEQSSVITSKLNLAKRLYRDQGKFIEEML